MTGFGQDGPMAQSAGHDINYIALAGVLHAIGRRNGEAPVPPLNLVGDFGGGGMFLAFGVRVRLARGAEIGQGPGGRRRHGGRRRLFDGGRCSALFSQGSWRDERGVNVLDGGAPWYDVYQTKDGKWLSVGAIEQRFYAEFVSKLGLDAAATARAARSAGAGRCLRRRFRGGHCHPHARRMGARIRRQRCLRCAGAVAGRGRTPPAQQGASYLPPPRRRAAASRPRRGSAAAKPNWDCRRARSAPTPMPCLAIGASARMKLANCAEEGICGGAERRSNDADGPDTGPAGNSRLYVLRICAKFGDDYWLAKDHDGGFPHDFHRALADAGWLGIAMPEKPTEDRGSASPRRR